MHIETLIRNKYSKKQLTPHDYEYKNQEPIKRSHADGVDFRKEKRFLYELSNEMRLGKHEAESCNEAKNRKVLLQKGRWFCS